ncbi:MAG: hypothetical protein WDW36_006932 [Sanguina aurantia]
MLIRRLQNCIKTRRSLLVQAPPTDHQQQQHHHLTAFPSSEHLQATHRSKSYLTNHNSSSAAERLHCLAGLTAAYGTPTQASGLATDHSCSRCDVEDLDVVPSTPSVATSQCCPDSQPLRTQPPTTTPPPNNSLTSGAQKSQHPRQHTRSPPADQDTGDHGSRRLAPGPLAAARHLQYSPQRQPPPHHPGLQEPASHAMSSAGLVSPGRAHRSALPQARAQQQSRAAREDRLPSSPGEQDGQAPACMRVVASDTEATAPRGSTGSGLSPERECDVWHWQLPASPLATYSVASVSGMTADHNAPGSGVAAGNGAAGLLPSSAYLACLLPAAARAPTQRQQQGPQQRHSEFVLLGLQPGTRGCRVVGSVVLAHQQQHHQHHHHQQHHRQHGLGTGQQGGSSLAAQGLDHALQLLQLAHPPPAATFRHVRSFTGRATAAAREPEAAWQGPTGQAPPRKIKATLCVTSARVALLSQPSQPSQPSTQPALDETQCSGAGRRPRQTPAAAVPVGAVLVAAGGCAGKAQVWLLDGTASKVLDSYVLPAATFKNLEVGDMLELHCLPRTPGGAPTVRLPHQHAPSADTLAEDLLLLGCSRQGSLIVWSTAFRQLLSVIHPPLFRYHNLNPLTQPPRPPLTPPLDPDSRPGQDPGSRRLSRGGGSQQDSACPAHILCLGIATQRDATAVQGQGGVQSHGRARPMVLRFETMDGTVEHGFEMGKGDDGTSALSVHGGAAMLGTCGGAGVVSAKQKLMDLVSGTERGLRARSYLRGLVEEAQVEVESYTGSAINYDLLEGKWKLLFTTANDVLPILSSEYVLANPFGPPPVQVGEIYQRFSSPEEGVVENIICLGVPFFLEDKNSITFTVGARYEVRSPLRIALSFVEARIGGIRIGEGFEALIAPALLPRTSQMHQLLLAIKELQVRFPFQSASQIASGGRSMFANYQLTYLDEDLLIGRATQLGGTFILTREGSSKVHQSATAAQ